MKITLFSIFLFASVALIGQETQQKIIDQFFKDYESLGPEKTLENLYEHMPWSGEIKEDLDNLNAQFSTLKTMVGQYYGYELFAENSILDRFSVHSYMVRYDRQPVRFVFKFYKPNDAWVLYGFKYDDSFSAELEESVKVNNLK